jgi:hypothetical protein
MKERAPSIPKAVILTMNGKIVWEKNVETAWIVAGCSLVYSSKLTNPTWMKRKYSTADTNDMPIPNSSPPHPCHNLPCKVVKEKISSISVRMAPSSVG